MKGRGVVALLLLVLSACGGPKSSAPTSTVSVKIQAPTTALIAGDRVLLQAIGSGSATLSYQWQLLKKPAASQLTFAPSAGAATEFVADQAGTYQVRVTVNDGSNTAAADSDIIVAVNAAPVINVNTSSPYSSLLLGDVVKLDGHLSSDPEQRPLSYRWSVLTQPAASAIAPVSTDLFDFAPQHRGDYLLQLAVSDGVNTTLATFPYRVIVSRRLLTADAASSVTAKAQVENLFGPGSVDSPLTHSAEHLTIANDATDGARFVFALHLADDGDREVPLPQTDRQRTEIKTYTNSGDALTCEEGERMSLFWQVKAEDIGLSYSFSHLFQIKGSDDHPLLTLTARRTSATEQALQVLHGAEDTVLGSADWALIKQRWLDVSLSFSCQNKGFLTMTLVDSLTKTTLLKLDLPDLDMWQDIAKDRLGFKFGLYRKVKQNVSDTVFRDGLKTTEDRVSIKSIRLETY